MKTWKLQWKIDPNHDEMPNYCEGFPPTKWHDLEEWSLPEHAALRLGWWEKQEFPMEFQVVEAGS